MVVKAKRRYRTGVKLQRERRLLNMTVSDQQRQGRVAIIAQLAPWAGA
jgi:hypothetical protein